MISYTTLGTNDIKAASAFYDVIFGKLGAKRIYNMETFVAWGDDGNSPLFAIVKPFNGEAATPGNGVMISIAVPKKELVNEMHAKALELGATDEGAPGLRMEQFYCGYFRDLDGNKLNLFVVE